MFFFLCAQCHLQAGERHQVITDWLVNQFPINWRLLPCQRQYDLRSMYIFTLLGHIGNINLQQGYVVVICPTFM